MMKREKPSFFFDERRPKRVKLYGGMVCTGCKQQNGDYNASYDFYKWPYNWEQIILDLQDNGLGWDDEPELGYDDIDVFCASCANAIISAYSPIS